MSDLNQASIKGLGLFSVLEAATEIKFFFLVTIVVLWIDNIFLYLHKLGIIELVSTKALQKVNLPLSMLLIFLTFSFVSSIALPVLSYFINQIYLEFLWQKVAKFFGLNFRSSEMPSDYVSAHKLRESAYMTKDKFLLDIYTSHEKAKVEREIFIDKLASRALCCLILLSINYFVTPHVVPSAARDLLFVAPSST